MNLEVIDNFYADDICKTLEEKLLVNTFPWGYLSQSIESTNQLVDFMFCHSFFQEVDDVHNQMAKESGEDERDYMISPCFDVIEPTIQPIMKQFGFGQYSLLRIKANLDTVQNEPMIHATHTDYPIKTYEDIPYTTAIFHVNDNNGVTVVGGEKIPQVANRLIVFDGSTEHYGITQTDVCARVLVNYNFRGEL